MRQLPTTIDDLEPAPYNPRTITDKSRNGLAASIEEFGDISGVTWNKQTGNLVSGHQRVALIKKLGGQLFRTSNGDSIELRVGQDGKKFPVRIVDWDLAKEKAANLTANNAAIGGEFNEDLAALLDEVRGSVGVVQFTELNLDALLKEIPTLHSANGTDPDEEWVGMPEFDQPDAMPYRTIKVHFNAEEHVQRFAKLLQQPITDKTKSIRFPKEEKADLKALSYESDDEDGQGAGE